MTRRESELQEGWVEVFSEPGYDLDIQAIGRAILRRWLNRRELTLEDVRWHLVGIEYERGETGVARVLIHVDELNRLGIDVDECLRGNPDLFRGFGRGPGAGG